MKLFALISVAAANWNGVSDDNTCGMQIAGASMVNSTCTVSGSSISAVFAGNGAFITSTDTFTGFDGISGNADVVVFFDQDCSSGECDNSTCWDAAVNCVDNGSAANGVFFMETVNDHRGAKGGSYNLQIAGVKNGDYLTFNLNEWYAVNITAPFGRVTVDGDGDIFSIQVDSEASFGDLFQVSVTDGGNTDPLNLWEASVVA